MSNNVFFSRENAPFLATGIITLLLISNIVLIHQSWQSARNYQSLKSKAENVQLAASILIRNIHLLDVGLRGYALVEEDYIKRAFDQAANNQDSLARRLEMALIDQDYEKLDTFLALKQDLTAYFDTARFYIRKIQMDQTEDYITWLREDRGYPLFLSLISFNRELSLDQQNIIDRSVKNYDAAMTRIQWLQVVLFLIAVPTLLFTAIFTKRSFSYQKRLKILQEEKNKILRNQNMELERLVHHRTYEIQAQNEEIVTQNEEITANNEQLLTQQKEIEQQKKILAEKNHDLTEAYAMIQQQNERLELKKEELSQELYEKNVSLEKSNQDLIEQNQRLEQFAFIFAHNLRAPIARIKGLNSLLGIEKDNGEKTVLLKHVSHTVDQLDEVIKDLMKIVEIGPRNLDSYKHIDLQELFERVSDLLKDEIASSQARIEVDFQIKTVWAIPSYLESIFYNLIANALKYKKIEESAQVLISSFQKWDQVIIQFEDKGLGFEVEKHKKNLYAPFKRFHSHVEGKGLGLFLVKSQAAFMGAGLTVSSRLGEGTVFSLVFDPMK